jgi:hypothetical protein
MPNLLENLVEREALSTPDGKSGSPIERGRLNDGRSVVIKRMDARSDWLMRSTHDDGRIERLWRSGLLDRMPAEIHTTILDVVPDGDGWILVMDDVSEAMLPDEGIVRRADSARILRAAAAMHEEYSGEHSDGYCTLTHRYSFLSPATAERERGGGDEVPGLIAQGWDLFPEVVPDDVADAVVAVLQRPQLLAGRLEQERSTLIHGDLKFGNIGLLPDRVAIIDWGDRTGFAPPAVEFGWYLAVNGTRIGATHDEVVDDFASCYSEPPNRAVLLIAMLGALVQLGWNKALGATQDDPEARAMEQKDLDWWIGSSRRALEEWSPN